MSQNGRKQWLHSTQGRDEPIDLEHVDAFILNPRSSQELVQRLCTDPAWDITYEESGLMIFVRSS